jgi:hypothetical protein
MKDWIALAAEFFRTESGEAAEASADRHPGVTDQPTKLTKPRPSDARLHSEQEEDESFDGEESPTKLTEPAARGVVSVLSVLSADRDDRVRCIDCTHYRHGHCEEHVRAGLGIYPQVGSDLASLPQRCPAFRRG